MISIRSSSRLGEALWQYCAARVLASRFQCLLEEVAIPGFAGTVKAIHGARFLSPIIAWEGHWPRDAISGRQLDRAELSSPPSAHIKICPGFQRYEFIEHCSDVIKKDWLRLESTEVCKTGDCVIGLREGDQSLSVALVRTLSAGVGNNRLVFVTDTANDPMFDSLESLNAEWFVKKGVTALRFIKSFNRIAFCQSELYWWAAFLSDAHEIFFPQISDGPWSHPEPSQFAYEPKHYGIDLRVTDEDRWIYDWWK